MNERTRRRLLRTLGAAGIAGLAGCSGGGDGGGTDAADGGGGATPSADRTSPAPTATSPTATLTTPTDTTPSRTTATTPTTTTATTPATTAAPGTTTASGDPPDGEEHAREWPLRAAADGGGGGDVALSGDGSVAVVSEYAAENPDGEPTGAVFTYERTGDDWQQVDTLFPTDLDSLNQFGSSVALSADAATLLVTAPFTQPTADENVPVAYLYDRDGDGWTRSASFEIRHGRDDGVFGNDVDLAADGRLAVVGSHTDDEGSDDQGQVRVFRRTDAGWERGARIVPGDGADRRTFGFAVAVAADPDRLLVGAWNEDYAESDGTGAAYVYRHVDGSWQTEARLLNDAVPDGTLGTWVELDESGETALVAVPEGDGDDSAGLAYDRVGDDWSLVATLSPHGRLSNGPGDQIALADDGATALVGQPLATDPDDPDDHVGQASVFRRRAGGWERTRRLVSGAAATDDLFGYSVALDGDGTTGLVRRLKPDDDKNTAAFAYDL